MQWKKQLPVAAQFSACQNVFNEYGFALENGGYPSDKIDEALTIFERVFGCNDSFWDSYWSMIEYVAEKMGLEEMEEE